MAPVSTNSGTKSVIKEKSKGTRKLLVTLKKTLKSINVANTVQQISNMHPISSNTRRTKRIRDEVSDLSPNRLDQSVTPAKKSKMKQCFIVTPKEMRAFFHLLGDGVIRDFLERDTCMRVSDKYLLAMVFAYFKRASYTLRDFTRYNFFIALYLANDMEEDEEELKYEIFPWILGPKWKNKYPGFLLKRDRLWKEIDYRAVVSKRCCEEVMAIDPENPAWSRVRPEHHGGALRNHLKESEDEPYPRGPDASPVYCLDCDADSQYDSASPASTDWYISSDSSPRYEICEHKESSFDMKGLKKHLPEENIWPFVEE